MDNSDKIKNELHEIQGLIKDNVYIEKNFDRINELIDKIDVSRSQIKTLVDEIDKSIEKIRDEIKTIKENEEEAGKKCNDANAKINIVCAQYFSYDCMKVDDPANDAIDEFKKLRTNYEKALDNWLGVEDDNVFYGIESRFISRLYEAFKEFSYKGDMRDIIESVLKSETDKSKFYWALEDLKNGCEKISNGSGEDIALTDKEKCIYDVLNDLRDNYEKICNGENRNIKYEIDFQGENGALLEDRVCTFPGIKKIQENSTGETTIMYLFKPRFEKRNDLKGEQ